MNNVFFRIGIHANFIGAMPLGTLANLQLTLLASKSFYKLN
jgi:hypothetical protein